MVGRRKECNSLQMVMESNEAEFVVVYGRRRVGKTFLINTYYNDSYAFKLTGLAKKANKNSLLIFILPSQDIPMVPIILNRVLGMKPLICCATYWRQRQEIRNG